MHQDLEHNGRKYRIISEAINVAHPCEAIVAVFELLKPGGYKEIWREAAANDKGLEKLERDARVFVKNL